METEEKTVKEWLNTLKEPYKSKALSQTNIKVKESKCNSITEALFRMFVWNESKEGQEYWDNIFESLVNKEI